MATPKKKSPAKKRKVSKALHDAGKTLRDKKSPKLDKELAAEALSERARLKKKKH